MYKKLLSLVLSFIFTITNLFVFSVSASELNSKTRENIIDYVVNKEDIEKNNTFEYVVSGGSIEENNIVEYVVSGGSIYFDKSTGKITDCDLSVTNANIPNKIDKVSVSSIGEYAFWGCDSLTEISIPNSVSSIGDDAFKDCGSLTEISIPNSVSYIGYYAFWGCGSLTEISIPNSVSFIGDFAFWGCNLKIVNFANDNPNYSFSDGALYNKDRTKLINLLVIPNSQKFIIPNNVSYIGDFAFYDCSSLTEISIPNSVSSIGDNTFHGCSSLTKISIPNSVSSIGNYAFWGCSSLTEISIPNSVSSIGDFAFEGCNLKIVNFANDNPNYSFSDGALYNKDRTKLISLLVIPNSQKFIIPDSVSSIENCAFKDCGNLTEISIPDSVSYIGDSAFEGCSSLTEISIPNSVSYIGYYVFKGCNLKIVNFAEDNLNYSFSDGALYNKDRTKLISLLIIPNSQKFIIPDSVSSVGDSAFEGCSSLTEISVPDSVSSIGYYAFWGCSSLTEISIPNSVSSIGNSTFLGCSSLTEISIPDSVSSIGNYSFEGCSSLTEISIPDSVSYIGDFAFDGCGSLTEISIPDSVSYIGDFAFEDCNNAIFKIYKDSCADEYLKKDNINFLRIVYMDYVVEHAVSGGSLYIDTYTGIIVDCDNVVTGSSITIPDKINEIDVIAINNTAFKNCDNLSEIAISNSITSIGDIAFDYFNKLVFRIYKNSYADKYLTKKGIDSSRIIYIDEETVKEPTLGDIDGNPEFNINDVSMLLQKVLNSNFKLPIEKFNNFMDVIDVNRDGNLTSLDISLILQKVLNSDFILPFEK